MNGTEMQSCGPWISSDQPLTELLSLQAGTLRLSQSVSRSGWRMGSAFAWEGLKSHTAKEGVKALVSARNPPATT